MSDEHPALFRSKIPWIIWFLVVDAIILSLCVLGGGVYLRYRQQIADHRSAVANARAEIERAALCGIFNHLPIGVDPNLDAARTAYRCAATVGRPLVVPSPTPTGARDQVKPRPRVTKTVVVPRPELVLTPGPTVTVTKQPTTQPSRSGRHRRREHHHPTPTPTCTSISALGMCLHAP